MPRGYHRTQGARFGRILGGIRSCIKLLSSGLKRKVFFGRHPGAVPPGAIVFFPMRPNTLHCGLAGIVAVKSAATDTEPIDTALLAERVEQAIRAGLSRLLVQNKAVGDHYLGGSKLLDELWSQVQRLKEEASFYRIFSRPDTERQIEGLAERMKRAIQAEDEQMSQKMGHLAGKDLEIITRRLDLLKDIAWCLEAEVVANIGRVRKLLGKRKHPPAAATVHFFRQINAILNSIDRLEVRGRDSAGISLLFIMEPPVYRTFRDALERGHLSEQFQKRTAFQPLINRSISVRQSTAADASAQAAVALTFKVALEIGSLGENIRRLRDEIAGDPILNLLTETPIRQHSFSAHTRWASVGAITEANCHPVDNRTPATNPEGQPIIHACLNGDIDNFQELKQALLSQGGQLPADVTTDTKIIPLQIEKYLMAGCAIDEAFRRAVNDFQGSHAICMHTDLAPGKLFLAQKGSGQAVFVGLAKDHYMPASEVYGFVEETQRYLKLDGESEVEGRQGPTQGQLYILDQQSAGGLAGISAMYYDGSPITLDESDIKQTALTSRDIDRQGFPHYFLKEISEAPQSVQKTLRNRWRVNPDDPDKNEIVLDETVMPQPLRKALAGGTIRRVFFIGQGTAGVAALACANTLIYYLNNPALPVMALKASEFSGFSLNEADDASAMADALVIAISQSGTTTDTNRTVDMVRERGAYTLAIVNRRDSDLTFKVDGVMYTSSGRDIEMSVASTKAFYSQIVAGALLGLYIAAVQKRRGAEFISEEIRRLLAIPSQMQQILANREEIGSNARRLAVSKTYWAAVGSGPNKASADEIRIKLSELCYKTISSDYVEDKKHIDLSSEPLIIVCAAGTRSNVIGDIIKDTAIFKAHKATPVVITHEGEHRFAPYADAVFYVPSVAEHLAPLLTTLVGHIWGYYAALAINEGSRFLFGLQEDIQRTINDSRSRGMDIYEIVLEKSFREKIAEYYTLFRRKRATNEVPTTVGTDVSTDLFLLMKYLTGRLPVSDFELDFGMKGTAVNMINTLFGQLASAISYLSRPVDAIKHQAKTVTVGTSRISERIEGLLFEALRAENIAVSQLTNSNVIVLKNLQRVIAEITGSILYQIDGLTLLGEPDDHTTIAVKNKRGGQKNEASRVESDPYLKGSKRIIVKRGNVYIGKGRKDKRSILIVPILSASPEKANRIENLLLLHIEFEAAVPLDAKIKALGGKYEHIKSIVQESSLGWQDAWLEWIEISDLFGQSAEKIGESIVHRQPRKKRAG
jgi:glucosamine--fructose-6-phosphate aminotransferase (isomerizing)